MGLLKEIVLLEVYVVFFWGGGIRVQVQGQRGSHLLSVGGLSSKPGPDIWGVQPGTTCPSFLSVRTTTTQWEHQMTDMEPLSSSTRWETLSQGSILTVWTSLPWERQLSSLPSTVLKTASLSTRFPPTDHGHSMSDPGTSYRTWCWCNTCKPHHASKHGLIDITCISTSTLHRLIKIIWFLLFLIYLEFDSLSRQKSHLQESYYSL